MRPHPFAVVLAAALLATSGCGYRLVTIQIDRNTSVGVAVPPGTIIAIVDPDAPKDPAPAPVRRQQRKADDQ